MQFNYFPLRKQMFLWKVMYVNLNFLTTGIVLKCPALNSSVFPMEGTGKTVANI